MDQRAERTLVKAPPELWELVDDIKHLAPKGLPLAQFALRWMRRSPGFTATAVASAVNRCNAAVSSTLQLCRCSAAQPRLVRVGAMRQDFSGTEARGLFEHRLEVSDAGGSVDAEYLDVEMRQSLGRMGLECSVHPNPAPNRGPFLIGKRIEDAEIRIMTAIFRAAPAVRELLEAEGKAELALRVAVRPGGCSGFSYEMFFDSEVDDDDLQTDYGGVRVVVDPASATHLEGATLDYKEALMDSGFSINNPNVSRTCGCGQSFS